MMAATRGSPRHDWLGNTGGWIGIALPLAVGAAVSVPDRSSVVPHCRWQRDEHAASAVDHGPRRPQDYEVVFAKSRLRGPQALVFLFGGGKSRPTGLRHVRGRPDYWMSLAKGMGVPGVRVTSLEDFAKALQEGFESGGPSLIEVPL